MDNQKTLTLEEIDMRTAENVDRLKVFGLSLKSKNSELGYTRGWKLPTDLIHKAIDKLEHDIREIEAEQEFLKQERGNVLTATAKKAAEVAAAEYLALREQLNPRAVEIIKGFCALQQQLIELEKVQALMQEKGIIAGAYVNTILPDDVIVVQAQKINYTVYDILLQIPAFTGNVGIDKAGIIIPDLDE